MPASVVPRRNTRNRCAYRKGCGTLSSWRMRHSGSLAEDTVRRSAMRSKRCWPRPGCWSGSPPGRWPPVEDTVTLTQFRALVIIASRGPLHLAALADAMGVHPSNATRACDRLVAAGLLDRAGQPRGPPASAADPDRRGPGTGGRGDAPPAGGDRADPARDAAERPRTAGRGAHPVRRGRRGTRGRGPVVRRLDHRILQQHNRSRPGSTADPTGNRPVDTDRPDDRSSGTRLRSEER